jgi:membrane protease YdiL (CAAX protease family)
MTFIRKVFDNRIARFVVLFAALVGVEIVPFVLIPKDRQEALATPIAAGTAIALLAVYWLLTRLMEHRPVREVALVRAPGGLIAGAAIGFALIAATMAILHGLGIATFAATPGSPIVKAANMAVLAAIGEEILARAVIFRLFEEMFGSLVALIVSAAFFGAAHLGNPGASLESGLAVGLEAGVLLAACYMWTRNLWLAIGLHFGWNFTEGGIFGAAVSGNDFKGLYHTALKGPELLTGGSFGAEGSIVAIAVCLAAATAILAAALRRGEWKGLRLAINDDADQAKS